MDLFDNYELTFGFPKCSFSVLEKQIFENNLTEIEEWAHTMNLELFSNPIIRCLSARINNP